MRQLALCALLATAAAGLTACGGPKVRIPARVDLSAYATIGIVQFRSDATGTLPGYAVQRFMQAVQRAQGAVRFLELGSEAEVLAALSHSRLDFEAARAIGQRWGVDAVFIGELDVEPVTPRVSFDWVKTLSVQADVRASLHTRLLETQSGTTVWTRGGSATKPVAHVRSVSRGPIDFGASDPERAYGALVGSLVQQVTDDFYAHWRRP